MRVCSCDDQQGRLAVADMPRHTILIYKDGKLESKWGSDGKAGNLSGLFRIQPLMSHAVCVSKDARYMWFAMEERLARASCAAPCLNC